MASMDIKSLYRLGRRKNMLAIIGCLFGIFVGIATAGYMFIHPLAERDKTIAEYKEQDEQLYQELKDERAENEDLKENLSIAHKEIELKNKQIEYIRTILEQNNYGRDDIKIAKLKELVANFGSNN